MKPTSRLPKMLWFSTAKSTRHHQVIFRYRVLFPVVLEITLEPVDSIPFNFAVSQFNEKQGLIGSRLQSSREIIDL